MLQPIAKSIEIVTNRSLNLLSRICSPAAEELGLYFRDVMHSWRLKNLITILEKTERKLDENHVSANAQASPRIVASILDESSWIDDSVIQDFWAGLLSSSCTETGDDDSNLLFVNILADLTKLQSRILKHACERGEKTITPNGLITVKRALLADPAELFEITGESDIQRLDRELDHLRATELIMEGFNCHGDKSADITPTPLALHLYVRAQGSRASPGEFFELTPRMHT